MLALLLLACSKNGDSAGDDTGPGDDSGAGIVYPNGNRILMYYGNGGFTPDIAGTGEFEAIGEIWKTTFGWNTDSYDQWPVETIDSYRLIALIAPGWSSIDPFDAPSVELLQAALDRGTRLVVVVERQECKNIAESVNPLLAKLGVSWTMTGGAGDPFSIEETNAVASGYQMTQNVNSLRMIDPCWVDDGSATVLAADDQNNFISVAERPGNAGDVVFLGDITMMDDTEVGGDHGFEHADNRTFLDNMVRITWK